MRKSEAKERKSEAKERTNRDSKTHGTSEAHGTTLTYNDNVINSLLMPKGNSISYGNGSRR